MLYCIDLTDTIWLTPQPQIVYSRDDFYRPSQTIGGGEVASLSLRDGDSLQLRLPSQKADKRVVLGICYPCRG